MASPGPGRRLPLNKVLIIAGFGTTAASLILLLSQPLPDTPYHLGRGTASKLTPSSNGSPELLDDRAGRDKWPQQGGAGARATSDPQSKAGPSAASSQSDARPSTACAKFEQTELWGDVVQWGTDNHLEKADDCCAACLQAAGCNVWVYCGSPKACGDAWKQCWLKKLDEPWGEVDVLQGKSSRWTSGIVRTARPTAATAGAAAGPPPEIALVTEAGDIRIRLFADAAPNAAAFLREVVRVAPSCAGCNFYRAEPVPAVWGSKDAPDTWQGGRWGPPYALMQGSFMPRYADSPEAALPPKPAADTSHKAKPLIRRGMLAWAGGGGGSDAFVALAEHPEWGHGHTVWGEVVAEDMAVVDTLMRRPIKQQDWGAITASVFAEPLPFQVRDIR